MAIINSTIAGGGGGGATLMQSETPAEKYQKDGVLWIDTSGTAPVLRYWTGSEWGYVGAVWK